MTKKIEKKEIIELTNDEALVLRGLYYMLMEVENKRDELQRAMAKIIDANYKDEYDTGYMFFDNVYEKKSFDAIIKEYKVIIK